MVYGPDYAMVGKFELNDDNTITPLESYVAGWGDSITTEGAVRLLPSATV